MQQNSLTYIPDTDRDFFVLLRAGLWQTVDGLPHANVDGQCRDGQLHEHRDGLLSAHPDWDYIFRLACQQTIQGIIADGIGNYMAEHPETECPNYSLFLDQSAQLVRQNHDVNLVQARICKMLGDNGLAYVVLKGQGVAQSYPKPLLRCSGDIDLFFTPETYEAAKTLLKPLSAKVEDKPLTLECALTIDGVDVELHGGMTCGINKAADKHLQTMLREVLVAGNTRTVMVGDAIGGCACDSPAATTVPATTTHPATSEPGATPNTSAASASTPAATPVTVPSANFDAIYVLTHTIRHLGGFGISLRQIVDWTMHMHANAGLIDREKLRRDIEAMHLQRLWDVFVAFATQWLGMPGEDVMTMSAAGAPVTPTEGNTPAVEKTAASAPVAPTEGNVSAVEKTAAGAPVTADKASALTAQLWLIVRASGSFGHNNPYFKHLHKGRLNERFARIYYRTKQALKIRRFDKEFSNYLLRNEIKDVVVAPFRFLSGRTTKITE